MKPYIATALLVLAPALALAQTGAAPAAKPAAKKSASAPKKAPAAKAARPAHAKNSKQARVSPPSSRTQLHSATGQVAAGLMAADAALSPEELDIAQRVYTGRIPCELGAFVNIEADAQRPGYFHVQGKGFKYLMAPVATSTGAVRLEDRRAGAVWLQIANKSMLMNQKSGQRLADECMNPAQTMVAEADKKAPPPSLIDAPAGAR